MMLAEVRKDRTAFRVALSRITRRVSEVQAREEEGLTHTPLEDFAGTRAAIAALELSIIHMEYLDEALRTQLAETEYKEKRGELHVLPGGDDEC